MVFAGMNILAIVVAALAAFFFGALYYGLLSRQWMRAARMTEPKMKPSLLAVTAISLAIMAYVLAGAIGHLGGPEMVTLRNGIISAAILWAGFILPPLSVNHRYQGFGWSLTFIDAGYWLGVLIIMGAIIGAFGI